jgi:hypothetical protein
LQQLKTEAEIHRAVHGIDQDAPLPPAAHVAPRFRYLAKDSEYLRRRRHTP